jgi:hypothetical protein
MISKAEAFGHVVGRQRAIDLTLAFGAVPGGSGGT